MSSIIEEPLVAYTVTVSVTIQVTPDMNMPSWQANNEANHFVYEALSSPPDGLKVLYQKSYDAQKVLVYAE